MIKNVAEISAYFISCVSVLFILSVVGIIIKISRKSNKSALNDESKYRINYPEVKIAEWEQAPSLPVQPKCKSNLPDMLRFWRTRKKTYSKRIAVEHQMLGCINFSLAYCQAPAKLNVRVIQAQNLPATDFFSRASDPYVVAMLLPNNKTLVRTKYRSRTLNPRFDETLSLPLPGVNERQLSRSTLCLHVLNHVSFQKDEQIGEVLVPLMDVNFEKSPEYWKTLSLITVEEKVTDGEILLSMCYKPQFQNLLLTVIKARDLPAKDIGGSSDPFVKMWVIYRGEKSQKQKTTVRMQCLSPIFNESLTFQILAERLQETSLFVSVIDYDCFTRNDEIGHFIIGNTGSESSQKHWKSILEIPGESVTMWHKLYTKLY